MPNLKCLNCDFEANTRTTTTLLKKLREHAASVHNVPFLPVEVINNVRLAMRSSVVVTSPSHVALPSHRSRLS